MTYSWNEFPIKFTRIGLLKEILIKRHTHDTLKLNKYFNNFFQEDLKNKPHNYTFIHVKYFKQH